VALLLVTLAASQGAADNESTSLVLHAIPRQSGNDCDTPERQGFDCRSRTATVQVAAASEGDYFLYINDFDEISGIQCKFEWPFGWTFLSWNSCRLDELSLATPTHSDGNLITAFRTVTRSEGVTAIGRLTLSTGSGGCLRIVESDYNDGNYVINGANEATPLNPALWGSVCVGTLGLDACNPGPPLPESSWGKIKATYNE
jgi:hypothetical protein